MRFVIKRSVSCVIGNSSFDGIYGVQDVDVTCGCF